MNTYAYADANPVSEADPLGLMGGGGGGSATHPGPVCDQSAPRFPDFINFQIDIYVGSVWGTFSRSGNAFVGAGVNKGVPNPYRVSASASAGWLNFPTVSDGQVDNFLAQYSGGLSAAYGLVGGGIAISPGNGTATVVGVGAGEAIGLDTKASGTGNWGYSTKTGQTGLGW